MALTIWILSLLFQCCNIAFTLKQLFHPFASPRWRAAWLWALAAHGLISARRVRLLILLVLTGESAPLFGDVWEQLLPLSISVTLFLFNWHLAHLFFATSHQGGRHRS